MDHRCCFSGSPGTIGLRLEVRHEADVDDGAPGAEPSGPDPLASVNTDLIDEPQVEALYEQVVERYGRPGTGRPAHPKTCA